MKRRIPAWLAAVSMVAAMGVATAASAHDYGPWQPSYAQEALAHDYAWLGYYRKHHNSAAVQAEEVRIAQEEHHLQRMRHFELHHDYSYHSDYPPGWVH